METSTRTAGHDGPRRRVRVIVGLALAGATFAGAAAAQMPSGPYSQWSSAEQQAAARAIAATCQPPCMAYANNGQRGAFEASACVNACFVEHLPADYPNMDALKHMAWEAYESAQRMGSQNPSPPFPRQ